MSIIYQKYIIKPNYNFFNRLNYEPVVPLHRLSMEIFLESNGFELQSDQERCDYKILFYSSKHYTYENEFVTINSVIDSILKDRPCNPDLVKSCKDMMQSQDWNTCVLGTKIAFAQLSKSDIINLFDIMHSNNQPRDIYDAIITFCIYIDRKI